MKKIKITKKQKYIIVWGGGVLLVSIAIAVPLIVQSTKQHHPSFSLSIIKNHMQMATNSKATREETQVALVKMYQNGTTQSLSSQAQKAVQALAHYIHANKAQQTFAFALGKDYQDKQLLLLTIASNPPPQTDASLQKAINQIPTSPQRQNDLSLVNQLSWVTSALHQAKFGILFWIYQNRLSSQEALVGTALVPAPITAVNFQRDKTLHEQLQDQAWAKVMQVVHKLTSKQIGIIVNAHQSPSQTMIGPSHIMLVIQNIITNDDEISKAASKLIKEHNLKVELNDQYGKIKITIMNYGNDKTITIFGFKATATPLEVAQAKINAAQDDGNWPTKLNQVFHNQTPRASDVNAPTKDGVTFKFQLATAVNDQGESTLTYEADANPQVKGTTPQEVTFVVSGFETKALKDAQAKISVAQNKIAVTSPTRFSQVFYEQTPRAFDANAPAKDGVTFKFQLATAVNDQGESSLTYEVDADPRVIGTTPQDVTFVVNGFETQTQAEERKTAQAKIDVAQDKIAVTSPTKLNQVFHGQMPLATDVNAPTKDGVTFKFQSATIVNDKGESALTYEVDANPQVAGTTLQDVTFVVSGFETKALKDAQAKISAAQNKIAVTSPTRFNQVFHNQTPRASNVNAPAKDGVTFKFQLATAVNDQGESTLTYEVDADPQVKETTPQDVTFVVSGFETQAQAVDRIAKSAQVVIKNLVVANFTTGIDKTKIAWAGKPLKADVLSDIKKQILNQDAKALISLDDITITSDNTAQTITIVIHNHGPSKTIIILGFRTIKDYLDQVLNAIPSSGGAFDIPEGITSSQFGAYVQAMGEVLNERGGIIENKFAEQYKAKITSLTIPHSFTTIGEWFRYFNKITSITISDSVLTIDNWAFDASPLTTLSLGDQLQTIGEYAFFSAKLTSLHIPNSVLTIGPNAFNDSPLTTLSLGDHLQIIDKVAFASALLTSLTIPDSVTRIGNLAFAKSPLINITIFDDVLLGWGVFKSSVKITQIPRPT